MSILVSGEKKRNVRAWRIWELETRVACGEVVGDNRQEGGKSRRGSNLHLDKNYSAIGLATPALLILWTRELHVGGGELGQSSTVWDVYQYLRPLPTECQCSVPQMWQSKLSLDIAKYPLGGNIAMVENHCCENDLQTYRVHYMCPRVRGQGPDIRDCGG